MPPRNHVQTLGMKLMLEANLETEIETKIELKKGVNADVPHNRVRLAVDASGQLGFEVLVGSFFIADMHCQCRAARCFAKVAL